MHRPRRVPIWIAALAMLLHLFAMPLMSAGAPGMAGHCTMAEASRHASTHFTAHNGYATAISHAVGDNQSIPKPARHLGMPCCCAGSASMAAIPSSATALHPPRLVQRNVLPLVMATPLSPRYRWPRLNPRASPLT
ncbi:DUF2946 domain-containing protein [Pseudomonas stutzeri]|uniref:DUF2946 family protein n=1 Tax=Stutzerimonas stutzeri TaxID=316 RepID=UPI00210A0D65|nr:DUF2946 family protein [Stutzerimonas stutzeri]MCQ4286181.1 DUF2946 domain-containing protein [Stutzerimonas stutzeri]